jgi:aminoglycoside phosphotransferase (APT) family kinase protein
MFDPPREIDQTTAEQLARTLLDHRRHAATDDPASFSTWTIEPAARGQNGVVWHASCEGEQELAIKISVVDERRRGEHEFTVTRHLSRLGHDVAPRPIVLTNDGDLAACVSSWCPGLSLVDGLDWDSERWSEIVSLLARVHEVAYDGLPRATPGASIGEQLARAQASADRAGRGRFHFLATAVRRKIGDQLLNAQDQGLVHADTNLSNIVADGDTIRLVDWEYSGIGDPCCDVADLCTSPSASGMPDQLAARLIREHAMALGREELVARTNAFVIVLLAYWCARVGAPPLEKKLTDVEVDPRRDARTRIDHYRDRLGQALELNRSLVDRLLER